MRKHHGRSISGEKIRQKAEGLDIWRPGRSRWLGLAMGRSVPYRALAETMVSLPGLTR
jgi:hypothetical protein